LSETGPTITSGYKHPQRTHVEFVSVSAGPENR
jgi:hypothetical protein